GRCLRDRGARRRCSTRLGREVPRSDVRVGRGPPGGRVVDRRRVDSAQPRVTDSDAACAAAAAARDGYGRLLGLLAAADGDLAGAEDALADALEQALRRWPEHGVPARPEAWLVTVARSAERRVGKG